MAITLVHDCDIDRRPDPQALNGDFRDCCMDQIAPDIAHDGNQFHPGVFVPGGKGTEYEHRALLLFDLTKFIPASATITAAVWWFYVQITGATGQLFRAVRCRRHDWKEDEATWNAYKNPSDHGTAESGTANTLTDSDQSWATDEWVGHNVYITAGTGAGQTRTVTGNNATTLTVSSNWTTNPDATSQYIVGAIWEAPGASGTTSDRDTGVLVSIGTLPTTGWKNIDFLTLVSDAWANRDGICTFIVERFDAFMTTIGAAYIQAKNIGAAPGYEWAPHHLRITYTLADRTFQVMVR